MWSDVGTLQPGLWNHHSSLGQYLSWHMPRSEPRQTVCIPDTGGGGRSLGCHVMRSGWALSRSSSTLSRAASKKNCQVQTKVVVKCLGWPVATCCSGNAHCYGQLQTMLLSNLWFSRLLLHFSYFSTALALSHFVLSQLVDLPPLPAFVFSEYTRVIPVSGSCCSQFELPGKFCCCLTG